MIHIALFADLSCPFAYVAHAHWRRMREHYKGRIAIRHRSLALEYVNRVSTPKAELDVELPILLVEEPDIPYSPWRAPVSEWPVTIWPAFEAVECAERQSIELADELAWTIRVAFFSESRCISMRHVLMQLAEQSGLAMRRFEADFDSGRYRQQVIDDAREGWERLAVPGSPTWILSSGEAIADFGLPEIDLDDRLRPSIAIPGKPLAERHELIRSLVERA